MMRSERCATVLHGRTHRATAAHTCYIPDVDFTPFELVLWKKKENHFTKQQKPISHHNMMIYADNQMSFPVTVINSQRLRQMLFYEKPYNNMVLLW